MTTSAWFHDNWVKFLRQKDPIFSRLAMFGSIVLPRESNFNDIIQNMFLWPLIVCLVLAGFTFTLHAMSNSLNISAASHEGKLFIVKQSVEANPNAVNTVDEVYFLFPCRGPCWSKLSLYTFVWFWLTPVLQDERTPLHWAASGGHLDITEYLILQKAQVDASDDASITVVLFMLCASTLSSRSLTFWTCRLAGLRFW